MSDLDAMRAAGKLAAKTLDYITPHVVPGVTTGELNDLCHQFTLDNDAKSAPLGYKGFPKATCTSINHVICHGIPGDRVLKDKDIMNIDITVILDGWHGDSSRMFQIGKTTIKGQKLCAATHDAMMAGIEMIKPGATIGDVGHAISTSIGKTRYSVVTDYCGHGIGQVFHDEPQVLNYGSPGTGAVLKEGMFITVEPMVNIGRKDGKKLSDGWTVVTKDRTLSAQWEHTIAVVKDGYEILTLSA